MSEDDSDSRSAEQSLSDELSDFFDLESGSVEGVREIIKRHGFSANDDNSEKYAGDYDFFLEACCTEWVDEEIIACLLEYFPEAINVTSDDGWTPLHYACNNENVTLGTIQLLIDATPDSVRNVNDEGRTPLHSLCCGEDMDEKILIEILKLLLEKWPELSRHADNGGYLPVHCAARERSAEFCRMLIEAYPGSEQIRTESGNLPLHLACLMNTLPTVDYFYKLYPDAINLADTKQRYAIHWTMAGAYQRSSPMDAVDIVEYLLDCDASVKLQTISGFLPFVFGCNLSVNEQNIEAGNKIIKALYDAHPKAIEDDTFETNMGMYHQEVQTFLEGELIYARQANDHRLMTTPDEKGQLPLHKALRNNVRLGSIKLLVESNPSALRFFDNNGAIPLHVACQYHGSPIVIQYLLDSDPRTLHHADYNNNNALHHACRGAKHETIAMLLEKYDGTSVSKRNAQMVLPIDLLLVSDGVVDRECAEYVGCVFLLLKAHPETVMNYIDSIKQIADASRNGKKRKLGAA